MAMPLLWAILTTPIITTASLDLSGVSVAHADDMAEAQKLYRSGERLFKDGDYEAAARDFGEAYKLSEKPELLYYIARSWEEVGELGKAQDHYQRYIDELPDAKNADEVIDKIIEIQERIATEMGRVKISTPTEGAAVFVDGEAQRRCETPCMLIVKPGSYSIKVDAIEGTQTRDVSVGAGEKKDIEVEFNVVKMGTLLVSTDAGKAILRVSGKEAQLPLRAPIELEEGQHNITVTVADDSEKTWSGQVTIADGEQTSLMIPLQHTGGGEGGPMNLKRVGAYSLASAGAGLLLGGVFMGLQTRSTFNNLEASRQAGRQVEQAMIDQGKSQQRISNVLFLTGGLAIAGGGGLFAWDYFGSKSSDKAPASEGSEEPPLDAFEDNDTSDVDLLD